MGLGLASSQSILIQHTNLTNCNLSHSGYSDFNFFNFFHQEAVEFHERSAKLEELVKFVRDEYMLSDPELDSTTEPGERRVSLQKVSESVW